MKGFYDKIIPEFMNKYTKKWGGKVGEKELTINNDSKLNNQYKEPRIVEKGNKFVIEAMSPNGEYNLVIKTFLTRAKAEKYIKENYVESSPIHSLDITPSMKESVMQGQAVFERGAEYEAYKGDLGLGIGNPYEYLKTLQDYNDRIANLYAESGDYKYAKELRAIQERAKDVIAAMKKYNSEQPLEGQIDIYGDEINNKIDKEITVLQKEGLKNVNIEGKEPGQLDLFNKAIGDLARYDFSISSGQLGLFNYNELAGREQLPDATTGKEAAESDTGNNDTDSKMGNIGGEGKAESTGGKEPGSDRLFGELPLRYNKEYLEKTRKMIEDGQIEFIGKEVNTPADLAYMVQVLRDPRFESFRVFYMKDGKIVGYKTVTSRLPNAVIFSPDMKELI